MTLLGFVLWALKTEPGTRDNLASKLRPAFPMTYINWSANMLLLYQSPFQKAHEHLPQYLLKSGYHMIESTKTTSMEDVCTGVLEKIKNI